MLPLDRANAVPIFDGPVRHLIRMAHESGPNPAPTPGRPRDDALAERRRSEILAAASTAFAGSGFRLTDVQVIADAVGVGKGTIYRYFPTKEALFMATVEFQIGRMATEICTAVEAQADPLEQMKVALATYLRFFMVNPEAAELIMIERAEFRDRERPTFFSYRDAGRERWEQRLESLMAQGRIRRTRVASVIEALENFGYGAIFGKYLAGRPEAADAHAADILDLILNGLLPRDGDA